MLPTGLLFAALIASTLQATFAQLQQGSICKKDGGTEWRCRSEGQCQPGFEVTEGEEVCEESTLCCPPNRRSKQASDNIANNFCQSLLETCRPLQVGETEAPLRPSRYADHGAPTEVREAVVPPTRHPYTALIGYGQRHKLSCGGILISEYYVLTPAHCAYHPALGAAKSVRLGGRQEAVDVDVAERRVHPEYTGNEMFNDLALLRLKREVVFTKAVKPACLYTMPRVPYEELRSLGWTDPSTRQLPRENLLVEARLVTQNVTACPSARHANDKPLNLENVLCVKGGGEQICQAYSGSALVVRVGNRCLRSVVGMATLDSCSLPHVPVLYTRISQYIPWIQNIVWP